MVQLSIRTKSFYLKLAQSYIFSLFIFVLNTIIYYRTYWFTFLQIVNIFLSIVCKPKRFLFCMFLFVVKWWEIPLEGCLVMCKWRAIRLLPAQEPVSIVFCEAFHLQENPFQPRTNPLWLSHHQRKKSSCLSWFVNDVKKFPSVLPRYESLFTIPKLNSVSNRRLEGFSFAGKQPLWRTGANKQIAVDFGWLFRLTKDGFWTIISC